MNNYFAAAAATLLLAPCTALAQERAPAHDFAGPRVEARIGYETPTVSEGGEVWKIGSAVSYGGEVGVDFRVGKNIVVGPYANYEFSSVSLCDGGNCLKEKGNLSVGGRIGVIAGGKALVYAKAGYASMSLEASSGSFSGSESKDGVQGALGIEIGFGKGAYGFVEASYADYGKFYGINLQRRQLGGGLGFRF